MKLVKTLITVLLFISVSHHSMCQLFDGNGYLIGGLVEVAIDGQGGHEGTTDWPGHHSRGGSEEVPFGFVSSNGFGWGSYNGDYFTAGTPENGFGIEINGVNYSNNGWKDDDGTFYLQEIPQAPGTAIDYYTDGDCMTVEWEGKVAGVRMNVKYHLVASNQFYTTEVTLINESGSSLSDVFYYRNVDPDNNQALTGNFATTNTIVSQPDPSCIKALVSAEQAMPWASYVGLGALGENFRVTYGGFSNRSGSDIWNGAGGLVNTLGATNTDDEAISLAYKTNLTPGQTVNFTYSVVLNEGAVEAAFSSLYFINYETSGDIGGGEISPCNPSTVTVHSCAGKSIMLNVDGPNVDDYTWVWSPDLIENDTIFVEPTEETSYTVTGTPTMECLVGTIFKSINVIFSQGPQIDYDLPGTICGEYDLTDFEYYDTTGGEFTNCVFLAAEPDSSTQTEPAFIGPEIGPYDDVWIMCGDTASGCFDYWKIEFDFAGPDASGNDSSLTTCGGPGTQFDFSTWISDSANVYGYFEELVWSGRFDDSTGIFDASNLYGTFVFMYIVEGVDSCVSDTAYFTLTLEPRPDANFEMYVDGEPFEDGLMSGCDIREIEFVNTSTIDDPFEIESYEWSFGDGDHYYDLDTSHIYDGVGTYTVTLKVFSENGCMSFRSKKITIYPPPTLTAIYSEPSCNGFEDAVLLTEVDVEGVDFTLEIKDEDGNILNEDGEFSLDSLGEGTYIITVVDDEGCGDTLEVTLTDPPPLEIYYRIGHPPCLGDSGYVVIDSVLGETVNNPIEYFWDPNPAGIEGITADSSYFMAAGDYTVVVVDSKGCTNQETFTLIDPPLFYFTEWGWDTAYCRLYDYQSGNGVVYAAAAGGKSPYVYEWTYLVNGTTSNSSTWGGRNPGEHLITITDAGGCVLTKIVEVDSVNPIADFDLISDDLNEDFYGTAPVSIEVINKSSYYANPNDPLADTTFFWDLYRTDDQDWIISHDYFDTYDTTYAPNGESYPVAICLIAFNKNGCSDTACKLIYMYEPPVFDIVNVFSPNGDGINDVLTFENFAVGIRDFECEIFNRWGVQVGNITGIRSYWDGISSDGDLCPNGVYFYKYRAVAENGLEFSGQGNVTIVDSVSE